MQGQGGGALPLLLVVPLHTIKNSIGNGEAKELICTTHGHELSGGNAGRNRDTCQRGVKGRK